MLFLIEYNRSQGQLVSFRQFSDADTEIAKNTRLELELDLNRRGIEREVVLFQATDEAALRRTHRRYFENLAELAKIS